MPAISSERGTAKMMPPARVAGFQTGRAGKTGAQTYAHKPSQLPLLS